MELKQKVTKFRQAIEAAKENGEFIRDIVFRDFPSGCCGDASDLLAEHLLQDDIKTKYICGSHEKGGFYNPQSGVCGTAPM